MSDHINFNEFFTQLLTPTQENTDIKNQTFKSLFEERIESLGITQSRAELILGIEKKTLNKILSNEAKRVDILTVVKLAQFLNLSVDKFINFYIKDLPADQIGEIEKTKKANYIVQNFDLSALYRAKFIESKSDYSAIESKILSFFGLSNLYEYSLGITPAFSKTKRNSSDLMREFWVRSAYTQFRLIGNDNPYSREQLKDLIPKIRPYTRNVEEGLLTVIRALYSAGVTIIYQPYLPNVQVRGATFVIDGKPCIVLTDLNKRYSTLWFALMHELHHVLYDFDEIEKRTYHLTDDMDLWLIQEDKANNFSREYLFGTEKSKYIEPFINDRIVIREYAEKNQVHPSIIYGFYMYDHGRWDVYAYEMPDIRKTVKKLNINPWQKETIKENIKILKEQVFNI